MKEDTVKKFRVQLIKKKVVEDYMKGKTVEVIIIINKIKI